MLQISCAESCKYHSTWMKGSIFQMSQMSCRTRRSISTMQVYVAKCWKYDKYHANSIVCFFPFFGFDGFASFLSWLWKVLRTSWLDGFVCVHLFTATKATIVRKPQTPPGPKQRPQHQHLLVCSSSYTTNNNHNSDNNNNNDNNNNKNKNNDNKVPLQLQL